MLSSSHPGIATHSRPRARRGAIVAAFALVGPPVGLAVVLCAIPAGWSIVLQPGALLLGLLFAYVFGVLPAVGSGAIVAAYGGTERARRIIVAVGAGLLVNGLVQGAMALVSMQRVLGSAAFEATASSIAAVVAAVVCTLLTERFVTAPTAAPRELTSAAD